ncbi:hypothetical protein [Nonomuraea sp. NPDC050202]|jgi:hypothetical protein|uniref:hypothetical protein n=1 Tax=Nonomuraea sp. NPDC050202 TaxID=3155035 RepID=UPI003407C0D3
MTKKIVNLDDLSDELPVIDEADLGLVSGGRPMERCYHTNGTEGRPSDGWVSDY